MLNESQQQAVEHVDGPCLTIAGPGSGKTYTLVRRIAHLVMDCNILPEQILVITFTKSAAIEMRERFRNYVSADMPVVFGTFHSVFYGILREELCRGKYQIITGKLKQNLIKDSIIKSGYTVESEDTVVAVGAELSFMKNNMVDLDHYKSRKFPDMDMVSVYRDYETYKRSYNYLDFDDMLSETLRLFRDREDVLRKWQRRFRYILIDEIQDMNQLQFDIIKELALPENNLFVVGDDDQSIYGFRGARPDIMLNLGDIYQDLKIIQLDRNYRSTNEIVEASQKLMGHNTNRFQKDIHAENNGSGCGIRILEVENKKEEITSIINEIKCRINNGEAPESFAVLFRKHSQSIELCQDMKKAGIDICIREKIQNPYEHFVAIDIMCYLKMASKILKRSDVIRIMNKPNRGLVRNSLEREWVTFDSWRNYYADNPRICREIDVLERDIDFLKKLSGEAAVNFIMNKIGYDRYLREISRNKEQYEGYLTLVDSMKYILKGARNLQEIISKYEMARDFMDKEIGDRYEEATGVNLYTFHGSKGLEFQNVYIMDCNEGVTPSHKAVDAETIEEERRMFYVAITRAKENLTLVVPKNYQGENLVKSRFIGEMGY
ncbi:MAG: ATP-dependent helicase [Lachnospiraceae bacterium]|nr:ATP-dependent helicase [Lachnospiraceae bacterium]